MARYSKGKLFWAIREQLKPADLATLYSLLAANRRLANLRYIQLDPGYGQAILDLVDYCDQHHANHILVAILHDHFGITVAAKEQYTASRFLYLFLFKPSRLKEIDNHQSLEDDVRLQKAAASSVVALCFLPMLLLLGVADGLASVELKEIQSRASAAGRSA